ncbi:hypothetical protein IQ277_24200 [Nostocales cyanobacterium LEGE 12452]|nr:hypothetical protein [Nostocales cyanobacterium LEGE 12452]
MGDRPPLHYFLSHAEAQSRTEELKVAPEKITIFFNTSYIYLIKNMKELEKYGLDFETLKEYQVLCLPENIETASKEDELIDTAQNANFCKLLREAGIKCANSYDLGLETVELERRGIELWFGVTYIIDKLAIPVVTAVISSLLTLQIQKKNSCSSEKSIEEISNNNIHIELRIVEGNNIYRSINYDGSFDDFKKIVNEISNKKPENTKNENQ